MSVDYRVESRVLDLQLTKLIRCSLLTNQLTKILEDSIKYFIYDLFYVKENENFIDFKNLFTINKLLEKNKTYLVAVIGSNHSVSTIGPYKLSLISEKEEIIIDTCIGDVVQIKTKNKKVKCLAQDSLVIGYEVIESKNLNDVPAINLFRYFISKPSWTNHFPAFD